MFEQCTLNFESIIGIKCIFACNVVSLKNVFLKL